MSKSCSSTAAAAESNEQRDRSLTVMIPRAKYRSCAQPNNSSYRPMSTFALEEHKLMEYLEAGLIANPDEKDLAAKQQQSSQSHKQSSYAGGGALVSAGFQVQMVSFALKIINQKLFYKITNKKSIILTIL